MGFVVSFIVISIFLIISRLDYFQSQKECENCGNEKMNKSHVLEKWIVQKLDNFDLTNNKTWLMRYYENDQFFNKSGPILIYFGGEWEIYPNLINEGELYLSDLAKEFNGSLFYIEHRYYGKSHPTNDTSLQHLKYLNVEQALEDFANFVRFLKMQPKFKDSKIMVFGASYSGTLAVWFRQQYPHLVDAVWASSAVLNLKVDFIEYKEAMTEAFQNLGGENCTDFINSTFMEIEEILESGNSSKIERSFNLSQPLKTPQDRSVFMSYISDIFAGYVQYHRNNSVLKVCKQLLESRYEDEIETVGRFVSQNKSLNVTYNHFLHIMGNVSWSAPVNRLCKNIEWSFLDTVRLEYIKEINFRETFLLPNVHPGWIFPDFLIRVSDFWNFVSTGILQAILPGCLWTVRILLIHKDQSNSNLPDF